MDATFWGKNYRKTDFREVRNEYKDGLSLYGYHFVSMSGVPIISEPGHNGGYTLLNNFIEAPLFFDVEEQTSLFHAAIFAQEAGYYGGEALNRAVSKLSNYSNVEQEAKINHHLASLEVIGRVSPIHTELFLKELEQALASNLSVKLLYRKNGADQLSERLLDPYTIIYWNNKWYVIGFCHLRSDVRSFRVDRIESLDLTEHKFNRPEDFSARDFFSNKLLPNMDKGSVVCLILSGHESVLDDISQHWFLGHYLYERTSNQVIFRLEKDIVHTYVPYLLLPYNMSIKVIEPTSLRKKIIEVLSELIKFHEV